MAIPYPLLVFQTHNSSLSQLTQIDKAHHLIQVDCQGFVARSSRGYKNQTMIWNCRYCSQGQET
jgi:hypothetical protein